ncbi:transposase, partial [Klebsiella pneumoniae]
MIDVLGPEKRRRRSVQEKIAIVQQSFEPGMTVSLVARQHGVAASQLFLWRKQYQEGSLTGTVAKLAMRQPFVLFKGLTFQKLCLPGAFRPGDHHNK